MQRILKALAVGLFLVIGASSANAQCSGNPPAGRLCGNNTASPTLPGWQTMSSMMDRNFGAPSVQGTILNRGASLWSATATPSLGLNGGTGGALILNGSSTGSATLGVKSAAGSTTFNLPVGNGTLNQVLITDGAGNTSWTTAGAGTVSSVGLALPSSILTVSGSPVTGTGTLTGTLATQTANFVWAGPTTGSAATPTFRSLVGADLPNPSASTLGGIQSIAAVSHEWISTISTSGVPTLSQPAFADISGTLAATQCPNPSATTIGCVESYVAVSHQWINTISTSGVPSSTQPNFTDLSGNASLSQLPSISNNSILANNSGGTAVPSALTTSNILDFIASTQGDVLYRGASGWVALAPGTNGQVLTTSGASANPAWTTVTGTGTVTSVATNNGITGGTITTTGTIGLATITAGSVMANITGGSAIPIANTPSSILDLIGSSTGNILYRSSGGWTVLAPGSNGQVLTQGSTTPSWSNAGTLTNVTISAGTGIGATGTCNITTTGTCTVALSTPVSAANGGSGESGTITGALKGNGTSAYTQAASTDLSDTVAPTSWTPTDQSGASLTFTSVTALYTKIDKRVAAQFTLTYPSTANGASMLIGGLPVASNSSGASTFTAGICSSSISSNGVLTAITPVNSTNFYVHGVGGGALGTSAFLNSNMSTSTLSCSLIYISN